MNPADSAQ